MVTTPAAEHIAIDRRWDPDVWKLAVVLACATVGCDRDRSVPPAAMVERHVVHRRELEGWMSPVPTRGIVSSRNGLGPYGPVEQRVTIDLDAKTLVSRYPSGDDGREYEIKTRTLPADDLRRMWELAELAWRSPPPATDHVSDYLELVIAAEGDDVMFVSVDGPMHPSAAARLTSALRNAAGFP